jgi:small subunit ribosomal protein S6
VRPYEVMIIFSPDLEEPAIESIIERSLDLLRSNGATPGVVNRWGKRTFAYEVKHQREGYYVVVEFSAEPTMIAELDRFLLLLDEVVRHKIVRLPEKVALRASTGPGTGRATAVADG